MEEEAPWETMIALSRGVSLGLAFGVELVWPDDLLARSAFLRARSSSSSWWGSFCLERWDWVIAWRMVVGLLSVGL